MAGPKIEKPSPLRAPWLHPILFAVYPVLYLWGQNAQEGNFEDAGVLLALSAALALALTSILAKLVFSSLEKAAVVVTGFACLFFSYGRVYQILYPSGLFIGRQRFLAPAFAAILLAISWWLYKRPESRGQRTLVLNTAGVTLVLLALSTLWVNSPPPVGLTPVLEEEWLEAAAKQNSSLPDVYYLILDGYGRADVLTENFGFDNSDFLESLEHRGFFVADRSYSNYASTILSLASSLNFGMLQGPEGLLAGERPEPNKLRELTRNNRLFRILGRAGYSRHVIAPRENFRPAIDPPEELVNCGSSRELFEAYLRTTAATILKSRWGGFTAGRRREVIECQFRALRSVISREGPKMVFFHSLVTHPPFLFHRDGSPRKVHDAVARKWRPWRPRDHYADQILFVNEVMDELIDGILAASPQAVIVLQGDHGPVGSKNWAQDIDGENRERFGILNAIRMPLVEKGLYRDLSPANTFRVFLREYLALDLALLRDTTFVLREEDGSAFEGVLLATS